MQFLNLYNLNRIDYYFSRYNKIKFGKQQKQNIIYHCKKSNFVINDLKKLIISLKKITTIFNNVILEHGIFLSFFKYNFKNKKLLNIKIDNFYIAFLNRINSLITGFILIMAHKKFYEKKTNYRSYRLPSIILMCKDTWNNNDYYFKHFIKFKIISIQCSSFYQNDINFTYTITIQNSLKIFNMLKILHIINNIILEKW